MEMAALLLTVTKLVQLYNYAVHEAPQSHLLGHSLVGRVPNDGGVPDPLVSAEHVPVEGDAPQTVAQKEVHNFRRRRSHYHVLPAILVA